MTPEEFADVANNWVDDPSNDDDIKLIKIFLRDAPAREIQRFVHRLNTLSQAPLFQIARVALEIKLAEDAGLIADKLSKQTDRLIKYTTGLYVLTFVLAFFAVLQIVIMLMELFCKSH